MANAFLLARSREVEFGSEVFVGRVKRQRRRTNALFRVRAWPLAFLWCRGMYPRARGIWHTCIRMIDNVQLILLWCNTYTLKTVKNKINMEAIDGIAVGIRG